MSLGEAAAGDSGAMAAPGKPEEEVAAAREGRGVTETSSIVRLVIASSVLAPAAAVPSHPGKTAEAAGRRAASGVAEAGPPLKPAIPEAMPLATAAAAGVARAVSWVLSSSGAAMAAPARTVVEEAVVAGWRTSLQLTAKADRADS